MFWYDVTYEMRRLALAGKLEDRYPKQVKAILAALTSGGRIVFSPEDDSFYQEFEADHVLHDPRTGKTLAVRQL
ncbi:MAG: hypothetical protein AB7O52_09790 [Planctomycetota bacterium]